MKKNLVFLSLALSGLFVVSCASSRSSLDSGGSSSASAYASSHDGGSSWTKGSYSVSSIDFSASEDSYEGPVYSAPEDYVALDGADGLVKVDEDSSSLSKDGVTYLVSGIDRSMGAGYFALRQGGYFTNEGSYSSKRYAGLKISFSRLTDYGYLLYKGSRYEITSPNNAAYHLYSDVYLPLFDENGAASPFDYVSIYAAVGSFRVDSLTLYFTNEEENAAPSDKYLDFYTINDTHGAAEYDIDSSSSTYQIGITRLSDYYMSEAKKNPDGSVILSSGDMWQGSADSNLTKGAVMVNWMNLVGFESMAIGNHEFDWGVDQIAENNQLANFPFLGINIKDPSGNRPSWALPSKIIYRQGVKIGIVGAIGNIASSIATSSLGGYSFDYDYPSEVSAEATRLRAEGCQAVVVSVHNGGFDTTNCHNVDAVFEGHTHQNHYEVDSYGIPHVQTYANGSMVHHLRFVLANGGVSLVKHDALTTYDAGSLKEEPMTAEIYRYYLSRTSAIKNEVVGHTDSGYGKDEMGAIGASSLLSYMRCRFPDYTIVAALINSGGVRQTIGAGDITFGDIYGVFPFDNENHLCSATGRSLRNMMSSGFYVRSDLPASSLDPTAIYYFVTLSYSSEGAYADSLTIEERDTYFIRNVVADYFRNGGQ